MLLLAVSTATSTFVIVAALLVIAAAMTVVSVGLVRRTRRDAPALGPLEVMGDRSWRRADPATREEQLASARPVGARPPSPMLAVDEADADEADVSDENDGTDQTAEAEAAERADDTADELVGDEAATSEDEVAHRYDRADG